MLEYIFRLFRKIKGTYRSIAAITKESTSQHRYRVLSINKYEGENYVVEVQLINKNHIFTIKPEEILASDEMTDSFSQRDIRTLTYLGYLGINSPKYRILAKRLSENDTKLLFAIHDRDTKKTLIKTANEISNNEEIIEGLPQKDAHLVGYAMATEQLLNEKKQMQETLAAMQKL